MSETASLNTQSIEDPFIAFTPVYFDMADQWSADPASRIWRLSSDGSHYRRMSMEPYLAEKDRFAGRRAEYVGRALCKGFTVVVDTFQYAAIYRPDGPATNLEAVVIRGYGQEGGTLQYAVYDPLEWTLCVKSLKNGQFDTLLQGPPGDINKLIESAA